MHLRSSARTYPSSSSNEEVSLQRSYSRAQVQGWLRHSHEKPIQDLRSVPGKSCLRAL
jgi:hypothetical protein